MVNKLIEIFLNAVWSSYMKQGNEHHPVLVARSWFIQKVLRINSHVPWPVHYTTKVSAPEKIVRGSRTPGFSASCHIDGRNGIIIGTNVWIGPRVSIISMNHAVDNYHDYEPASPIVIGDNCWLAANSVILPGVELGPHTIVAAGAVVTKSFNEGNLILGGVPAKVIKKLGEYAA